MTTLMTAPKLDSNEPEFFTAAADMQPVTCPHCRGTGEVVETTIGHGVSGIAICQDCDGRGVLSPTAVPRTSVVEAAGWLIIDLEMPGVVARDLDVVIDGNWVTIKSLPRVDAPATPVRIARDHMRAPQERMIELPGPVDLDRSKAIKATLLDDVLRLVLPIEREDLPRATEMDS